MPNKKQHELTGMVTGAATGLAMGGIPGAIVGGAVGRYAGTVPDRISPARWKENGRWKGNPRHRKEGGHPWVYALATAAVMIPLGGVGIPFAAGVIFHCLEDSQTKAGIEVI
jgi:hypothetical protein